MCASIPEIFMTGADPYSFCACADDFEHMIACASVHFSAPGADNHMRVRFLHHVSAWDACLLRSASI